MKQLIREAVMQKILNYIKRNYVKKHNCWEVADVRMAGEDRFVLLFDIFDHTTLCSEKAMRELNKMVEEIELYCDTTVRAEHIDYLQTDVVDAILREYNGVRYIGKKQAVYELYDRGFSSKVYGGLYISSVRLHNPPEQSNLPLRSEVIKDIKKKYNIRTVNIYEKYKGLIFPIYLHEHPQSHC